MGHQSYVLLCTETTLSNPPVVSPKSSCDVHLLRSPCPDQPKYQIQFHKKSSPKNFIRRTLHAPNTMNYGFTSSWVSIYTNFYVHTKKRGTGGAQTGGSIYAAQLGEMTYEKKHFDFHATAFSRNSYEIFILILRW